ncbi:MAG: 1-deoxy-D-xylulose-5-phosphate reductoisomerase, partial [Bacilli bacterium]|nr:1-deoxy-D-xylulose-5-phosphate reductoisomerase [Bacilli bacterium]
LIQIKYVYLLDKEKAKKLKNVYPNIKFYDQSNELSQLVKECEFDICVDALVGFAGMEPALETLKKNKILCLANKEALVAGGTLIKDELKKGHGKLYPIDSEHVALARCINEAGKDNVTKLIITASGGALRNVPLPDLKNCKAEDALRHPNWSMGKKITIDCATMINKGFEIIEAYYLFDYPLDKIEVLMHDESLIHSAVKTNDDNLIVDYGEPDMHGMIEYALLEGKQEYSLKKVTSLDELKDCHFRNYDPNRYPLCELAKECLKLGASKMVALNAANEVAVNMYLNGLIGYLDIYKIVKKVVDITAINKNPSLEEIKKIDFMSRMEASK